MFTISNPTEAQIRLYSPETELDVTVPPGESIDVTPEQLQAVQRQLSDLGLQVTEVAANEPEVVTDELQDSQPLASDSESVPTGEVDSITDESTEDTHE
jgi:hypothetical protein